MGLGFTRRGFAAMGLNQWGYVWVVERNLGVLTVGLGLSLWVWDLLAVGLLPWV